MILILFALFEGEFFYLGVDAGSWGRGATNLAYPVTSYQNPASTLLLKDGVNLTGSKLFGDLANLVSGNFHMNREKYGIGFDFVLHSVSDIENTTNALIDEDGDGELDPGEELDEDLITYFSAREGAVIGSYARKYRDFIAGVGVKFLYKRIGDEVSYGAGSDAGIIYRKDFYSVALMVRDLTTSPLFWDGRTEHIAPSYMLGMGMNRKIGNWDVLMEIDLIQDDYGFNHRLGLEAGVNEWLSFRTGFINDQLTAGAGLKKFPFAVDYAVNIHSDLPMSHRITLLYSL